RVPLEDEKGLVRLAVPNLQRAVAASRYNALTAGIEGHAAHPSLVALEGEQVLSRGCIPHLERAVSASRDNAFAVAAVRHAAHGGCVALDSEQVLASGGIPLLLLAGFVLLASPRGDALAIWTERHTADR